MLMIGEIVSQLARQAPDVTIRTADYAVIEAEQALVQAAATEAMTWQKQITREQTEEGLSLVQAEGMELYEPTKAELEAFRMAAQPSFDKWSERVGLELVDLFQSTKLSAN